MHKEAARRFVKGRNLLKFIFSITAVVLFSQHALAELSVPGEWVWTSVKPRLSSEPPMWKTMRKTAAEPMAIVDQAEFSAAEKLNEIRDWNRQQRLPTRNGFSHVLESPAHITFDPGVSHLESGPKSATSDHYGQAIETSDGDILWSASVVVDDSYRLRLHLENVDLPDGVQMWVHSDGGEYVGPFGTELVDDEGSLWTPSVSGPELTLVVLVPEENTTVDFTITKIAELFKLDSGGQPLLNQVQESDLSCLVDAQCVSSNSFSAIEDAERAVALFQVMGEEGSYVCTGGLISDTVDDTSIPYFLTANHCISNQNLAASLEAFWDYKPSSCGGSIPSLGSLPRTSGSKLLVAGESGDFALVELNSVPSGRRWLGWHTGKSEIEQGAILHRISQPEGGVQSYAQTRVDEGKNFCKGLPKEYFIYQSQLTGGTAGGSSGAPVLNDSGQVVGQLFGGCGDTIADDCDYSSSIVDGALSSYWPDVKPFLAPGDSSAADLALTFLDAVNGTYSTGDELSIDYDVENIGGVVSDAYRINFYASDNTTISSSDYSFGYIDNAAIEAGDKELYTAVTTIPDDMPGGMYYIGAIVTLTDANSSNNTRYDSSRVSIEMTSNSFQINPGLNGSWYNPDTNGQGFLIDVLPKNGTVFLAWFTYETVRPPSSYTANLGEPGHRWLTAQGSFSGNKAQLHIVLSAGGVFDKDSPAPSNSAYGTMTLKFLGCNAGTITVSIPGIASSKVIPIQRIVTDNVGLCESLNADVQ